MSSTALECGPRAAVLEIGGTRFDADAPGLAEAIVNAYGAHWRPRCLCRPDGVEMYVARVGDGYVVKRMPETGGRHAPDCRSFEPPTNLSGLSHVLSTAITENPRTGETDLRLAFPMSSRRRRTGPMSSATARSEAYVRGNQLSLRGLLHYLWDQAELTRWHPGFIGRRPWAVVRRHLLCAAERKTAGKLSLQDRLYVPEPFSAANSNLISHRQKDRWRVAATASDGSQQLMLMISEVKAIAPGRHGYSLIARHVPSVAFALTEPLFRAIGRCFERELAVWNAAENVRMVAAATFGLTSAGVPAIRELTLMPVTAEWLPIETVFEMQLLKRLVQDGRAFRKLLRFDLARSVRLASVALTDRGSPAELVFAEGGVATGLPNDGGCTGHLR